MTLRAFRYSFWSIVLALSLLLMLATAACAQAPEPLANEQGEPAYDEAEANAINRMIMCPVCPAETIDQAQVPIARQMRQMVREMLAQGATREEILEFFAQRYGQDILAAPPKSGFNLIAWIFPIAGVAAALLAGVLVLRAMSRGKTDKTGVETLVSQSEEDLEAYLNMVDRELALDLDPRDGLETSTSGPSLAGVEPQREEGKNHDV